jgi:hypothetical protein
MRQFAVYQGYNKQTKRSTWLFLQCPKHLQSIFINLVTANRGVSPTGLNRHPNPTLLEYLLMKASGKWRDYVNDLEAEIVALVCKFLYALSMHPELNLPARTKKPATPSSAAPVPNNTTTLSAFVTPKSSKEFADAFSNQLKFLIRHLKQPLASKSTAEDCIS